MCHRQSDVAVRQLESEQKRLGVELLDPDVEIFFSFQIEPAPVRPLLLCTSSAVNFPEDIDPAQLWAGPAAIALRCKLRV